MILAAWIMTLLLGQLFPEDTKALYGALKAGERACL